MAVRNTCLMIPIALMAAAMAAGCSTAPSRFYTLDSTATADSAPPAPRLTVMVGPVTVPDIVDRPEFVVQVAPNRVDVDEFNRWAAPLDDGIARAVAGDLAVQLGTRNVSTGPLILVRTIGLLSTSSALSRSPVRTRCSTQRGRCTRPPAVKPARDARS
jgi:uncharacterized lipoprotein YmbA